MRNPSLQNTDHKCLISSSKDCSSKPKGTKGRNCLFSNSGINSGNYPVSTDIQELENIGHSKQDGQSKNCTGDIVSCFSRVV